MSPQARAKLPPELGRLTRKDMEAVIYQANLSRGEKPIENTGEIGVCNIFCSIQNSLWRVVLQLIYGIDHAFHVRMYIPLGSGYLRVAHDFLDRKRINVFHREGCSGCMAA